MYFPVVLFITLYKVVLILSLWMKSSRVTIQMQATEKYFPVVLFITLYKVVLTLSRWMKSSRVTIQKKVTEKYFLYAGVYFAANQIKVSRQYFLCRCLCWTGWFYLSQPIQCQQTLHV